MYGWAWANAAERGHQGDVDTSYPNKKYCCQQHWYEHQEEFISSSGLEQYPDIARKYRSIPLKFIRDIHDRMLASQEKQEEEIL